MEAQERIRVEMEQAAASRLAATVNRVLVNGDVRARIVQENAGIGECDDAVVTDLQIVERPGSRLDTARAARESETVNDRIG